MRISQALCCFSLALGAGCANMKTPAEPQVSFEIRGLKNERTSSTLSYGTTTRFSHKGTVVAKGDSAAAHADYVVFIAIKRVSGGDPESPRDSDDFTTIIVRNGIGEIVVPGGSFTDYNSSSFSKDDKPFEPEIVEVRIMGYLPIRATNGPSAREGA